MKNKLKLRWYLIVSNVLLLNALTFSPWVLNPSIEPRLFEMPFTLWISILITILMVILTVWGGNVFKKMKLK
jgi:hypothetical protein|tara:strand:+ start:11895 stop:12110 length:216 start_codon:yes stop_codon:yes gene_type:complete